MDPRIDELIQQIAALPDPASCALAIELVQAIMRLHASALQRILKLAPDAAGAIAADELVSRVLVLHGLHPDDFATRFARAIERVRRSFDSRGAGIEVLESSPDLVHVRLIGLRPGLAAAARMVMEDAIYEAVPEIGELIVEAAGEKRDGIRAAGAPARKSAA
jgi:hypothetical protein